MRRDAIDVARTLALFVVVMGHLTLAVVDRDAAGAFRGANLLALRPDWAWLAAGAPMPVFFAAAGWAGATATSKEAMPRLRRLIGLGAVVVGSWSVAVVVTNAIAGHPGIVGDGARIATQPLWFLAVYVPCAATGRVMARSAAAHPVATIGGCVAVVAVLDVARFGLAGPSWLGWAAFYPAWAAPWFFGGWWRARWEAGRGGEGRAGAALAVGAGIVAAALVAWGGYQAALIDAVAGARSNTTPPTVYTAAAGLAQVGVLVAAAGTLDRVGRRFRRLWDRAGELAVGVYLWHLTALTLCVAALALRGPAPARLTALWWATRPLWWLAVLAVTAGLVAVTGVARSWLRTSTGALEPGAWRRVAGLVVGTAGAGVVGLEGPTTVGLAALCSALVGGSWVLLRPRRVPAAERA